VRRGYFRLGQGAEGGAYLRYVATERRGIAAEHDRANRENSGSVIVESEELLAGVAALGLKRARDRA
jgi:hypothetical protein